MHHRRRIPISAFLPALAALLLSGCVDVSADRLRLFTDDGNDRFQNGSYATARQSYEVALSLKPGDPALLYQIGQCYERTGNLDAAEHTYQECTHRNPEYPESWHALVALLARQNRSQEAEEVVQTWLVSTPSRAGPLVEDGFLSRQSGNPIRALTRFQQALDLEPRNTHAMIEMARTYEEMHRPDRALVLYERALACNPHQPDIRKRLDALRAQGVQLPRPD